MANILVIDDDQTTRSMLGIALEAMWHTVSFAPDGEKGLELATRSPFDVIVTDLAMPGRNGFLVIKELKELYPHVKIIAISGSDASELDRAEEYGAKRTLAKPVKPKDIQNAVEEVLKIAEGWDRIYI